MKNLFTFARSLFGILTLLFICNASAWAETAEHSHGQTPSDNRPSDDLNEDSPLHLADEHPLGTLRFNRLEHSKADTNSSDFEAQVRYGYDYQGLLLNLEGSYADASSQNQTAELLYRHAISGFWDLVSGLRHDLNEENNVNHERDWLAFGIQGLSPYWFEVESTLFVGEAGLSAIKFNANYDLLITQVFILQARTQANLYSKRDDEFLNGSGLADALAGLRLRYEISRQFAPYLGLEWTGKFGETADFYPTQRHETHYLLGLRCWY